MTRSPDDGEGLCLIDGKPYAGWCYSCDCLERVLTGKPLRHISVTLQDGLPRNTGENPRQGAEDGG